MVDDRRWGERTNIRVLRDKTKFIGFFKVPTEKQISRAKDRKVDFVIPGTAKGGTTALDAYLRLNPEICMPHKTKDINFFNTDKLYSAGEPDYRLYHSFFKPKKFHRILGEASPDYLHREEFARRVHAYNPDMKIILTLRDPVDRAFSNWNMLKATGWESLSFGEAIRCEEERTRATIGEQTWRTFSYVDRGFYVEQIRRLRRYFPPGQILVIKQEELLENNNATLSSIWQFLEVKAIPPVDPIEKHVGSYSESMSEDDRDYLKRLYWNEIKGLEQMLDWDCRDWLA